MFPILKPSFVSKEKLQYSVKKRTNLEDKAFFNLFKNDKMENKLLYYRCNSNEMKIVNFLIISQQHNPDVVCSTLSENTAASLVGRAL